MVAYAALWLVCGLVLSRGEWRLCASWLAVPMIGWSTAYLPFLVRRGVVWVSIIDRKEING